MFDHLTPLPEDPILGLMAAYRADPREQKIDLGVGVYMDDRGHTPVMQAVHDAEARLYEIEDSKTYQGIAGDADYNQHTIRLLLGEEHPAVADGRVASLQTPGGSGALRIGAEVIRLANPEAKLWVGVPTWPNHIPLLGGAGFQIEEYPYYDTQNHQLLFDRMIETLQRVPAGDIVLLHGCCHNPTGADLSREHWQQITELALERGFVPLIDIAYQGLGDGIEEDAYGLRLMAKKLPELVVASSCSKNFGLYRERTGSTTLISASSAQIPVITSQAMATARKIYSMPPAHGALLVSMILGNDELNTVWRNELTEVRERLQHMRKLLVQRIEDNSAGMDFSHILHHKGMFSYLGVSAAQLQRLREEFGVYIVNSTRINLAGINSGNIDYLADSILEVLK